MRRLGISLLLIVSFVLCTNLSAEQKLYKWIDKDGKVHYSDKPPKQTLDYQSETLAGINSVRQVNQLNAVYASNKLNHVFYWLLLKPSILSEALTSQYQVGWYHFGHDCVSPTALKTENILKDSIHHGFFPSATQLSNNISQAFYNLGYSVKSTRMNSLKHDTQADRSWVLEAQIVDLDLRVCEKNLPSRKKIQSGYDPLTFSAYGFKSQQVYLKVHWRLINYRQEQIAFDGFSEASINDWTDNKRVSDTLINGMEQAVKQLSADAKFQQALSIIKPAPSSSSIMPKPSLEKTESNDSSFSFAHFSQRAKLAKVMTFSSTLKVYVLEHYMSQGEWPQNAMLMKWGMDQEVLNDALIEQIQLDSDGAINLFLDSATFGSKTQLRLIPKDKGATVLWRCETNFSESLASTIQCK